jgi:hypothetical protein
MKQDTLNVFQNPVDSVRVAAEDVTSEKITSLLDFQESLYALWNLAVPEYIAFVCVSYYVIVTRVQVIKTNSVGRRNLLMLILTVVWGIAGYYWREKAVLNLLATGLFVNAAYEYIFKGIFKTLERVGFTPLPGWHVEEIREEKEKDIIRAEQNKNQNHD